MGAAAKKTGGTNPGTGAESPARLIDAKIKTLGDWRGEMLTRLRKLIHEADPDIVEGVKWRKPTNPNGVPVWEHAGTVCTGETYQDKVKLSFARRRARRSRRAVQCESRRQCPARHRSARGRQDQ